MHPRTVALLLACGVFPLQGEDQRQQPVSPLLSGALRTSGLPEAAESVTLPLNSTFAGFTVEVHIEGKPVRLVLDTGAALTVVSPETARKLGLETEGDYHLHANEIQTHVFTIPRGQLAKIANLR